MKAVILDFATIASEHLDITTLESQVERLDIHAHTDSDEVFERTVDCEIAIVNKVKMNRQVIDNARKLRFIGLFATGVDNIDLDAARDHDIAVCNIRGYCTNSVVEHVFGVLLQLTHGIGRYQQAVRAGHWQTSRSFCMLDYPLRELSGMTLGIVGYGELGKAVAGIAEAFGMHVLIARRSGTDARAEDGRIDLEALLPAVDVLSLHCPLTDQTANLIGTRELGLMKRDAFLINTARGGLVDSQALVESLAAGRIAGAAIDVLRQEPPVDGDPLLEYPGHNLLLTPHIAWATDAARQNAVNEVATNVAAYLQGARRNRVV